MKRIALAALVIAASSLCGCRSVPSDYAPLCSKISAFANATTDSSTHVVELITDWGGQFSENKNTIAEKTCKHDEYKPGVELCNYLMENSSTEFPDANLNAVMVCLGAAKPSNMAYDFDFQSTSFWSHITNGVRPEIIVGVDYTSGTKEAAPTLKIKARKDE